MTFDFVLQSNSISPTGAKCLMCNEAFAVIRCCQCSSSMLLCSGCDSGVHQIIQKNPLHDRDVWINGFFQDAPPTVTALEDGSLGFTSMVMLSFNNIYVQVFYSYIYVKLK